MHTSTLVVLGLHDKTHNHDKYHRCAIITPLIVDNNTPPLTCSLIGTDNRGKPCVRSPTLTSLCSVGSSPLFSVRLTLHPCSGSMFSSSWLVRLMSVRWRMTGSLQVRPAVECEMVEHRERSCKIVIMDIDVKLAEVIADVAETDVEQVRAPRIPR